MRKIMELNTKDTQTIICRKKKNTQFECWWINENQKRKIVKNLKGFFIFFGTYN
jgi:hypothetical protein